jgi:serine/threonine protein kinase
MPQNPGRALEIFTEAVHLPSEERVAFLDRACNGDAELRWKVEALLRSNDRAGDFLEEPPTGSISERRAKVAAGEKPGDRIGKYKLLHEIGEGGCGVVFVAEQQEPIRRRVALKLIKPGMDTKSVIARFEAERQAMALMDHPNIAHIFDAGTTENGRPYFVMELVEGVKISDYCNHHSRPLDERLKLFIQVCDAIQHAHQKGIIHRDIKPSNVLVTTAPDGKPVPKVIDFGIAKATTGQQLTDKTIFTACEMLIGTPAYMSPEQAALASTEVDTRTDIYSLGVLLYELLTGTTPFDARELLKAGFDEIRRVVREEEPVRPSTRLTTMRASELANVSKHHAAEAPKLIREMRGDLDWIVMKTLEKDRTRRYATANGLAMDIERYLSGEAVLARPPSAAYRFRKLAARNKLLFSGVAATFLLLVISLITTTRWLVTERRTQERMRRQMELARLDNLGLELYYQNRITEAEETILKALEMGRQFPMAEYTSDFMRETMLLKVFLNKRKFDKIKPFFDAYVDPAFLSNAQCRAMFETATRGLAGHGRWNDAALLADELYKFQPTNSAYYQVLAPLMVARGDLERYRRLCGEINLRFSDTTNHDVAEQMTKACLILPSSGVDLKSVAALADVVASRGSDTSAPPRFRLCQALAEFRLGHYEQAVNCAQPGVKSSSRHSRAHATAIMAMSQFRLNHVDAARTMLADCNQVIEKLPKLESGDLGSDWRDWIIAHALQSEAKRMIHGEAASAEPLADSLR